MIGVLPNGEIGQLYYGKRVGESNSFEYPGTKSIRPMVCSPKENEDFSLELVQLEYPSFGTGDFRSPAFEILQDNGSRATHAVYKSHVIIEGKKKLDKLPATYVNSDDEASTLIITVEDTVTGVQMELSYTIWNSYPVICRNEKFKNISSKNIVLNRALSMCLDLPDKDYQWIQFQGAWGRERHLNTRDITEGTISVESRRGHSSAVLNPFIIVKKRETTEEFGEAIGLNLVYSGNFLATGEVDSFGKTRITMGINPAWFSWPLEPGDEFQTPEVVLTYSAEGLGNLSRTIHSLFSGNLVRGPYKDKVRPILLNNWEATGMDFDEASVLEIARKGKEAGVELFVLDDGWFGKRNDDYAGLGDWYVNTEKLPDGMEGLAEKIRALGLKFGFWIEPEMVNEDSDLYRAHPDWVLAIPDRDRTLGRHQMVLDYSKNEVVEYIYELLYKVFASAKPDYIKWDMNRSISECYSIGTDAKYQGTVYHRYVLGVYSLYERLMEEFPNILFESCASGGARFDAGMLYYAPQAWCSDDTDAAERVYIQYGSSFGYPIASIGSHVSAVPNQQTGRNISMDFRAAVAYFGTFGYELDLNELDDNDFGSVKKQVEFMKAHRDTIQRGDFYRLKSPFEHNTAAWMSVARDCSEAVVGIYMMHTTVNGGYERVKLKGLSQTGQYRIGEDKICSGDYLMNVGIDVHDPEISWFEQKGDYRSKVLVVELMSQIDI